MRLRTLMLAGFVARRVRTDARQDPREAKSRGGEGRPAAQEHRVGVGRGGRLEWLHDVDQRGELRIIGEPDGTDQEGC